MTGGIVTVGVIVAALLGILVYALMRVSAECDHAARCAEKKMIPYSDVEITRAGTY
jgi:hypothetical protein